MNPHLEALQICPLCPPYALKSLTSVYESSSKLLRFNCLQKFFSLKTIPTAFSSSKAKCIARGSELHLHQQQQQQQEVQQQRQ